MNPTLQRFGPPILVFGAALYLGWPPAESVDYGSDVVKAKAVRWKPADLEPPKIITTVKNPFEAVLVASDELEVEPETGKLVVSTKPAGPPADAIQQGLAIDGIAVMGSSRWAVINGRPQIVGDVVNTTDSDRFACEIIDIQSDHIRVRSEGVEFRVVQRRGSARSKTRSTKPSIPTVQPAASDVAPDAALVSRPPVRPPIPTAAAQITAPPAAQ